MRGVPHRLQGCIETNVVTSMQTSNIITDLAEHLLTNANAKIRSMNTNPIILFHLDKHAC